jgi:hypothetical protein
MRAVSGTSSPSASRFVAIVLVFSAIGGSGAVPVCVIALN